MTDPNPALYVASYDDPSSAAEDFKALKQAQADTDLIVVGAVVIDRDEDGAVKVEAHDGSVGGAAGLGAVGGLPE
ncbi:hypothetical protein E8D34_08695 [Nocardioides sp. GY 10113]|uniref:hypothetical protein n=1 Tax=Nocardioides sp. GY 10113 TaxID=2569761 RepID=UPI0010A7F54D|nr:hypothetical protein [Nocardioides sp. GY 10113]TIC87742.1 hypothetical protein E8D34_08695 [Nocardioides sp. GY 10113]